ncbi:MAG: RNA polymerase sigma-70 factor [Tannerellaceae bacterium]|nr:RNA polymerase sigma-70 factor [Tannerellaceae bacterium]
MLINHDSFYITELKHGSHKAFSHLYDVYADMLYGFVVLHTKSTFLAEEIVQDTFVKIWSNRESLQIEGSFKSLLFTIAKNQMIDAFRRQINKEEFLEFIEYLEEKQSAHNPVEADVYFEDFKEKLEKTKQLLPERQRLIFELNREQGLDIKTIAGQLSLSEQTVKNQLSNALKTLRNKLKEYRYMF